MHQRGKMFHSTIRSLVARNKLLSHLLYFEKQIYLAMADACTRRDCTLARDSHSRTLYSVYG